VKRDLIYTIDAQLTNPATIFLGKKHAANFISQALICCTDTLIVDNLDFVYETNILGAPFSEEIKRKNLMTFTYISVVVNKEMNICGIYMDLNGIAARSSLSVKYEVILPIPTFN
jgi:hypothetical protein